MKNLVNAGIIIIVFLCWIWFANEFLANEDEDLDVPIYEWEIK